MTPAELAAAVLASPEALIIVAEALPGVKVARGERERRPGTYLLRSLFGRSVGWVDGARCWWEHDGRLPVASVFRSGVSHQPRVWEKRTNYEPCAGPVAGLTLVTGLLRDAGWTVLDLPTEAP